MSPVIPSTPPDYDHTLITERPDGFYWLDKDEGREYGPFASLLDAVNDMHAPDDDDIDNGDSIEEAEREIGISDWIDPETGVPGEDGVPHIEDH